MGEAGLYIYCVLRENESDGLNSANLSPKGETSTICQEGLVAVVSQTTLTQYDHTPEYLLVHFEVLSKVMEQATILPMSFGTVAKSETEVKFLLSRLAPVADPLFARLKGKVEFDLEARWNRQVAYPKIAEADPQITALKEKFARLGTQISMEDQIAVGKLMAEAVVRKAEEYSAQIQQGLCEIALESAPLKKTQRDQELFMNRGFFLEREKMESFEKKIYSLAEAFQEVVHFKYAGPLPPYSFTGFEIRVTDPALFEEARKQLELGKRFTPQELKESYRRLSMKWHPDRMAATGEDLSEAAERFKRLAAAYGLFELFFEQCGAAFSQDELPETTLLVVKAFGSKQPEWVDHG